MEIKSNFLDLASLRRSCYALTNRIPIADSELMKLVQEAVQHAPSAFNSQSARVLVLLGGKHIQFWKLVLEELQKIIPPQQFPPTGEKLNTFAAAYGTILFFEDWPTVEGLQQKYPAYKDNFPVWAYQANGMLEYMIWTALAEQNIGASLQHYNPLVDKAVQTAFGVPPTWKLIAQMPFGVKAGPVPNKSTLPINTLVFIQR